MVDGLETFTRFLKTEFSDENIAFWIACEDYKKSKDPQQIIRKAKAIYETFIQTDAPQEVKTNGTLYVCVKVSEGHVSIKLVLPYVPPQRSEVC